MGFQYLSFFVFNMSTVFMYKCIHPYRFTYIYKHIYIYIYIYIIRGQTLEICPGYSIQNYHTLIFERVFFSICINTLNFEGVPFGIAMSHNTSQIICSFYGLGSPPKKQDQKAFTFTNDIMGCTQLKPKMMVFSDGPFLMKWPLFRLHPCILRVVYIHI